jgi:Cu(I)/Ag(I) efflux system membrane fusion protein
VPSEALIRTGKRTLVMLALGKGRYRPAEVRTGRESDGDTEIVAGLSEGEKIVASGQFLLDSEASLTGVHARPVDAAGSGR